MAAINEGDFVSQNPLGNILDGFLDLFETICAEINIRPIYNTVKTVFLTAPTSMIQSLLMELLTSLQLHPASLFLLSGVSDGTLRDDVESLMTWFTADPSEMGSAIPLVEYIIENYLDSATWEDAYLWISVYKLVAKVIPSTTISERDTPSQIRIRKSQSQADKRTIKELDGYVFENVENFLERYFTNEDKIWSKTAKDIFEKSEAFMKDHWDNSLESDTLCDFSKWFMSFQSTYLTNARHQYYTSENQVIESAKTSRKLDIFLASAGATFENKHDWSKVLVVGKYKPEFWDNPEDDSAETLVQLAGHAREVFISQPARRFVFGFTIHGINMRLWVFDRSSAYSSQEFSTRLHSRLFVEVLAGYALMTDEELGLNTFIKEEDNKKYIIARGTKIYLEDKPIVASSSILGRATTCFRGKLEGSMNWEHVVKFAWPSNDVRMEGDLLKIATERGVTKVARWFHHEKICIDGHLDTIKYLQRGLGSGTAKRLTASKTILTENILDNAPVYTSFSTGEKPDNGTADLINRMLAAPSSPSFGQEYKSDEIPDTSIPEEDFKSNYWNSNGTGTYIEDKELYKAENPQSTPEKIPKEKAYDITTSYNRVNYCVVTSPPGRPLHEYRSVTEFLEALRDAIKGHRSLLLDGDILHQDISENNIIICESSATDDQKGMLIDLDMAEDVTTREIVTGIQVGTLKCMAIEVLEGKLHSFRHDLESFFYVLIGMCIPNHYDPAKSVLTDWYTGSYTQIARNKLAMIGTERFNEITNEFSPDFTDLIPLARDLRDLLFPLQEGKLFTGTPWAYDLYDGFIAAFDKAIEAQRKPVE